MNDKLLLAIFFVSLATLLTARSQVVLEPSDMTVTQENRTLKHPFAGGMNSPQYHSVDFDFDGDMDLVLFDRSADKINCFENRDGGYVFNPKYEHFFPEGLQNWMVLRDYDCDGDQDLFASSQIGIQVYQNRMNEGVLAWEQVVNPLLTDEATSPVNIFLNTTDIPSIEDLDGDGDLDILLFNFASGQTIEYYENISMDESNECGLLYTKSSVNYGNIHVCDCSDISFQDDCSSGERILHIGGKAILSIDLNEDQVMDLVISEEDCNDLSFLENKGNSESPVFDSFNTDFPTLISSVDITSFPAAYAVDVTMDGQKDILVSPNVRDNSARDINFQSSSFLFENHGSNEFSSAVSFLQDEMIDVGEWAYPAIMDVNGDGLQDVVLGNKGAFIDGGFVSTLSWYSAQSDGSLVFESNDLFGLSALGHTDIKPQFIDLNEDGKMDLFFTSLDEGFSNRTEYLLNISNDNSLQFDPSSLVEIALSYNTGDDVWLYDMDEDGDLDALIGRTYGELDYFRNEGAFVFDLAQSNFLESGESSSGNMSIATGDLDENGQDDLVLTDRSGQLKVYFDFPENRSDAQTDVIKYDLDGALFSSRLGRFSKPALGRLFDKSSLAIGSVQGGFSLYEINQGDSVSDSDISFWVYPNPSGDDRNIVLSSSKSGTFYLSTFSGQLILRDIELASNQGLSLDLSYLKPGIYIGYIQTSVGRAYQTIVLK